MKKIKNFFLDLFLPRQCIGCKTNDTWLCKSCFKLIKPNSKQVCYICRKNSYFGQTCASHLNSLRKLNRLLVAAHYSANPVLKDAIHALKYQRHPEDIADKLGQLLLQTLQSNLTEPANSIEIIPIPLHKKRLKERGFNQAELIAQSLSSPPTPNSHRTDVLPKRLYPTLNTQLLTRSRYTTSQVQNKSRENRLENLKEAFSLSQKPNPRIIYLLIDDVATTGSTLEECCQILKENEAQEVWGLVVARN
ncbi:MAG: hypothetical protein U1C97_03575 [Candidatus Gracilibacteria bacterium]|nr:hypothetical protein [bacterium]MDZ4217366.1 hypothetical protein [Candidatus Gracilibacteria bacterium]